MFHRLRTYALCGAVGVGALSSAAMAELTHVGWTNVENGMDGVVTIQFWAQFDNALDSIEAVYGNQDRALRFLFANGETLVNFGDNGGASASDDNPGNDPFDSWVGFGGNLAAIGGQKTPDFWGVPFGGLLTGVLDDGISGLSDNNSSYFVPGGLPVGALDSGNRVTIAQYSFVGGTGQHMVMTGGIQYNGGEQELFYRQVLYPAPGALAIFGLAAIGPRRRRGSTD